MRSEKKKKDWWVPSVNLSSLAFLVSFYRSRDRNMEIYFPRSKNYTFTLEDRRVKLILVLNNNCNKIIVMLVPYLKKSGNASLLKGPLERNSRDQVLILVLLVTNWVILGKVPHWVWMSGPQISCQFHVSMLCLRVSRLPESSINAIVAGISPFTGRWTYQHYGLCPNLSLASCLVNVCCQL